MAEVPHAVPVMTGSSCPRETIAKKVALYLGAWTTFALFFFKEVRCASRILAWRASLKLLLPSWLTQVDSGE
jgi:hypothetical protein